MDGGAYGTCFLTDFQLQDPSQGRTTKAAHGAPGRRRLRDELPFYGTLIYGPRHELPCGSRSYGTEACGRRQRELTGRRGEGACGTSPLLRGSELITGRALKPPLYVLSLTGWRRLRDELPYGLTGPFTAKDDKGGLRGAKTKSCGKGPSRIEARNFGLYRKDARPVKRLRKEARPVSASSP